jgi:hypothetical protein
MFNKKNKPLEKLDRNELIIKWGDEIIFNVNHFGEVSIDSFMLDNLFDLAPPTQEEIEWRRADPARRIRDHVLSRLKIDPSQLDVIGKELESYLTGVKNHLLSHAYIKDPVVTERFWKISDEGKSMKELRGHKEYKAYKKRKFDAEISDQNSKIYYIPIIIAILGIAVSGTISWLVYDYNKTKTGKVEERLYKLDTRITLKQEKLQSQVDSILNSASLSKQKDTTIATPNVVKKP